MRTLINLLQYEATRKPKVADLVARAADLTDEEIATADVPLPWFRKALVELRQKMKDEAFFASISFADIEPYVTDGYVEDGLGDIRRWQGGDQWVNLPRDNQLLVKEGMLMWFPVSGGVWIDSVFVANPAGFLVTNSIFVARCGKTQYAHARQEQLLNQNPMIEHTPSPLERPWTIY